MTGYEAANLTLDYLGYGEVSHKEIIPIEEDEAHIKALRRVNSNVERFIDTLNPLSDFFMM